MPKVLSENIMLGYGHAVSYSTYRPNYYFVCIILYHTDFDLSNAISYSINNVSGYIIGQFVHIVNGLLQFMVAYKLGDCYSTIAPFIFNYLQEQQKTPIVTIGVN